MNSLPRKITLVLVVVAFALVACKPRRPAEITPRQRMEAAQLASEAQFAITLKDWARAERLLTEAVKIVPDPAYWITLGTMRARLKNRDGAKNAYRSAIKMCEALAAAHPTDVEPWLKEAYALALLGQVKEGRAVIDKAVKRFPDDRKLRGFVDSKQFDAMIASPEFKEISL